VPPAGARDGSGGLEDVGDEATTTGAGLVSSPPRPSLARAPAPAYASVVGLVSSRAALWLAAAWGFAEASLFFIVPDAWLGFVALFAPRRMPVTLAAVLAGAAAGAVCLYLATLLWTDELTSLILALPAVAPADLEQARAQLADDGAGAILPAVVEGRAVKLYVHGAALDGTGAAEVVLFTVLNRLVRLLVFGSVMAALGWAARAVIARWPRTVAALYVVAWIAFYAVYIATHQD
jgi:hypothetical protein